MNDIVKQFVLEQTLRIIYSEIIKSDKQQLINFKELIG